MKYIPSKKICKNTFRLAIIYLISVQFLCPVYANIAQTSPFKKQISSLEDTFQDQNNSKIDVNRLIRKIKHLEKIKLYGQYQAQYPNTSQGRLKLETVYKNGDITAGAVLATYYFDEGYAVNSKAMRLLKEVSDAGDPMARFLHLYVEAYKITDLKESKPSNEIISRFDVLATQEGVFFKFMVGYAYAVLPAPFRDEKKAFLYVKDAYDSTEYIPEFSSFLGMFYLYGIGTERNPEIAYGYINRAAGDNVPLAQVHMGIIVGDGIGVTKKPKEAIRWFNKAAEQSNPLAMRCLGMSFQHGWGVKLDKSAAKKWFKLAGETGDRVSEKYLAMMLYENSTSKNKALQIFNKLSEMGDIESLAMAAWMYEYGEGTPPDYKKAFQFRIQAAQAGHGGAQNNLGVMYRQGKGVEKNDKEAAQWYKKAADQGLSDGLSNIGYLYAIGEGVEKKHFKSGRLLAPCC